MRGDVSFGHELVESGGDRRARHAQFFGERPARWQSVAGRIDTGSDLLSQFQVNAAGSARASRSRTVQLAQ
ncbi:hypothetical protein D3C87_1834430 [compost metagenome]